MDAQRLGVLVGVDGSQCGQRALDWAAVDAAARGTGLTVVHVLEAWRTPEVPLAPNLRTVADRGGQKTVDAAVVRARHATPDTPVKGQLVRGNPAAELLRLAAGAAQVVIGSRGIGGFAAMLLGSVGAQVAAHAPCPTVVVRGHPRDGGQVTVGVDGSERGEAALEYGFGYAARHGLGVQALHLYPNYVLMPPYPTMPDDLERVRADATRFVQEALGRWAAKYPDVPADWTVTQGGAAHHLIDASEGSSLLVVGCRGHGGFAGLLLGSVSQAAVRNAHCPVAVAR